MPLCAVCSNPKRTEIEALLVSGRASQRIVSHRYGMDQASVHRHMHNHIPELVNRSEELRMRLSIDALVARIDEFEADVDQARQWSKTNQSVRDLAIAVQTGQKNVALLAGLAQAAGLLKLPRPTVDADTNPDAYPAPIDTNQLRNVLRMLIESGAAATPDDLQVDADAPKEQAE